MRKRMAIIFFSFLTLLFLSSCGTPTVIDFTDAVSLSRVESTGEATLVMKIKQDEFVNVSASDLDASSPSVLLLYNISDSEDSTSAKTRFSSAFSSDYKGKNFFGRTISNLDDGICEISSTSTNSELDGKYRLFPLMRDGVATISDPTYTYSQSESIIDFLSNEMYRFVISKSDISSDEFELDIDVEYSNDSGTSYTNAESTSLKRFNGENFYAITSSNADDSDYSIKTTNTTSHTFSDTYVNFYAAVNLRGDFSNIYWTSLYYVGSLQLN